MIFLVAMINVGRGLSLRHSLWTICLKNQKQKRTQTAASCISIWCFVAEFIHHSHFVSTGFYIPQLPPLLLSFTAAARDGFSYLNVVFGSFDTLSVAAWFFFFFSTPTTHLVKLYKPSVQCPRPLLITDKNFISYHNILTGFLNKNRSRLECFLGNG